MSILSREELAPFDAALQAEYRVLAASVARHCEQAERLQALADHARSQAERDEQALVGLAQVLGLDPQLVIEQLDDRLRGARLQEIAVRVLAEHQQPGEAIHYKQWYGLLRTAGYAVGGKDPLASFLAAIGRSAHVQAVGQRSGLYVLTGGRSEAASAVPTGQPSAPAA
jgi:hypothetical protein